MSGTSLDGIDVSLLETDGRSVGQRGPRATYSYAHPLREALRATLGGKGPVDAVERDLTLAHAAAVKDLLTNQGIAPGSVDLVGFHGHTILHRPEERRTWQIGDGRLLAATLGLKVVCDFRSADVAAGGQGAPLVPLYHAALAHDLPKPLAVLNIGGVANVTWIGVDDHLVAFDTGPGNALIDDWMLKHTGTACDEGGAAAARGQVDDAILARLLTNDYFGRTAPKSLDRDDFSADPVAGLSVADGAATLTAFTATAVARACDHLPVRPLRWLVTGGGRHNHSLMSMLAARLAAPVDPVEAVGWDGDGMEAEAFAFLAQRALRGLPLSLPTTTGVPAALSGGRVFDPLTSVAG